MSKELLFLAVLPSILLGYYIYKNDKMGKESSKLLLKLFLGGIGSAFLTIIFGQILCDLFPILDTDNSTNYIELFVAIFFGVALLEEFFKWIMLKTYTWKNKEFNHIYDAIVYAVFVSLGFATFENILYVSTGGLSVAILRAIVSVPGHAFNGVSMGYHYGISKQAQFNSNKVLSNRHLAYSLIMPTILHGVFDYLLMANTNITLIIYITFIVFLYISSFAKVRQLAKISFNFNDKYCSYCGVKGNGEYCVNCGNKL